VAFAAGTAGSAGALLLSGTGALAARFAGGEVERRCDGYGWLLGDEGSAVWIGLRALRAVLAALDGRGEPTALVRPACELLGAVPPGGLSGLEWTERAPGEPGGLSSAARAGSAPGEPGGLSGVEREVLAQAVVAAGFARPPAELGLLAPVVSAAADAGDRVAGEIADAAAAKLLRDLDTVGLPAGGAVVLAGSVLLTPGPVARAVRAGVLSRTGVEPRVAADGAGGAAALAVARLTGRPVPPVVHARLTGGADPGRAHEPGPE
jgi:N-acetylglucosamine kinase-like BadF-type ATPase